MTVHWAFTQLGIDPTKETAEIRRAYARRLKAMDVDADVNGYAELRNARDAALAYAAGVFDEVIQEESGGAAEPAEVEPAVATGETPESTSEPAQPASEIALAQQRLIAVLFPGGEQMYHLTPEEAEEALRCFEVLKSDPRLDQIDMLASASDWFAQVVAQSLPRSDPLVRPVADYFGWSREQLVGVHPAVAAVVVRANALDWRDRLQSRKHRHHRAWKELTKPAHENSKRGWVSAKRIAELLREVRTRYPSLESDMDWYRVSMWENGTGRGFNWGTAVLGIFFVIQVISFATRNPSAVGSPPTPTPVESVFSAPLTDPQTDIGGVLNDFTAGSVSAARLKAVNPKLYGALEGIWQSTKNGSGRLGDFADSSRNFLVDLVPRSWSKAPYSALRHKMEAEVHIAQALSPSHCASLLGGRGPAIGLADAQADLRRRAEGELLLTLDPAQPGPPPGETYQYKIPGPVVAAAVKRSGLTHQQFTSGISLDPPGSIQIEMQCSARLALRESILGLPQRDAYPILRDMED